MKTMQDYIPRYEPGRILVVDRHIVMYVMKSLEYDSSGALIDIDVGSLLTVLSMIQSHTGNDVIVCFTPDNQIVGRLITNISQNVSLLEEW